MIVDVAVPVPLSRTFHYLVDEELAKTIQTGSVLRVPFGSRGNTLYGFVVGLLEKTSLEPGKLKNVEKILVPEPLFDEKMLEFFRWVAQYYCHPIGEVISTALPKYLCDSLGRKKRSTAAVELTNHPPSSPKSLTEEQAFALARILEENERPVLLHGVTGSGKTEVYLHVLAETLKQGKSAIVLVPEIALTPLLVERFASRFPELVAVIHSDLTATERKHYWEQIQSGQARIVVGARSAVFAPLKNLGLIVVDEEHETSFKQEDSLRYHARDVAIVRAKMFGAKVILGSATPSLESFSNAEAGKYLYVTLKKRIGDRGLPKIEFVDMKNRDNWVSPELPWMSRVLTEKIYSTLKSGGQTMLYLNRLGFAHFLYCADCGHTWRCNRCDVALTYYESPPSLKCHYCGLISRPPNACPACQGTRLEKIGVGTERLEKELVKLFPEARIARMDRSQIKNRKDLELTLKSISNREVDIIIGTQMITKGHDFPGIALVGIVMADASLNIPDFRSNERTYQIITQVSGRAGRAELPGEVIIQSINPDHPVLHLAAEQIGVQFYLNELGARKKYGFPPFRRLALLRFQHRKEEKVQAFAEAATQLLRAYIQKQNYKSQILGPAQAPLSKLKNLYRWQCLIKGDSVKEIQDLLRVASQYLEREKTDIRLSADVDPIHSV